MSPLRAKHWQWTRALTLTLLLVWLLTTLIVVIFARQLASITIAGWPLHYYLASQGATLVYLAIVGIYAWSMQRIDALADDQSSHEH
ncbi:MAG: DUF4212 domain-containing protein [Burkholderiaceae bacterium]|jgi:putative solute:sodium symporter small subunit